jgi:UDP-glucose 4-epimerase
MVEMVAPQTVWHLAANSDIPAGVADPNVDLRDTFLTTYNVLNFMRRCKIEGIAFASTSAVYGEHKERLVETLGPLLPISNYGAMKLASEGAISAAVESVLKRACIFRFPNVVGSRGTHGVIYDLICKLMGRPNTLEVLGDGRQRKPYLHVSELVDAMLFIWDNAREKVALYNIGPEDDGAEVSYIAQTVVEVSGRNTPLHFTGGDRGWVGDVPRFRYSVEKLARLGWRPKMKSADAVRRAAGELALEREILS